MHCIRRAGPSIVRQLSGSARYSAAEAAKPKLSRDAIIKEFPFLENQTVSAKKTKRARKRARQAARKASRTTEEIKSSNKTVLDKVLSSTHTDSLEDSEPNEMEVENDDTDDSTVSPTDFPKYLRRIESLHEYSTGPILEDLTPPSEHKPIATLGHGLDRVLFNPGVHWLQDPRSRVYNFTPWLEYIPKVTDFAFERLAGFVRSSMDSDLFTLAKREGRKFAGSTSSLTGIMCQIYFLLSENKGVDTSPLSKAFRKEKTDFTPGQRMPATVMMNYEDGVYRIDSYETKEGLVEKNILLWMGTMLEKFFTMSQEEFKLYLRSMTPERKDAIEDPMKEAYRFSKSERFVMRSQLDCQNSSLPGTGVFDIKTRAALPVRMDMLNFEENSGYLIRTQHGHQESFEREYYDLIRSAFLKYSFQARIGNMDGVFVAYHNTGRTFGFQYIPLSEMEERLYGPGVGIGERVFNKVVGLMEIIAEEVSLAYPQQSVKCTFETFSSTLEIYVEPEDIELAAERNLPSIKLIEVEVGNYLSNRKVKGKTAVSDSKPWTIHYSVSHVSYPEEKIRWQLKKVMQRKFRAYSLPTGVNINQVSQYWDSLNFTGSHKTTSGVDPNLFKNAGKDIEMLRQLSREGRADTRRWADLENGLPKRIVGDDGDIIEDSTPFPDYGYVDGGVAYVENEGSGNINVIDDLAETDAELKIPPENFGGAHPRAVKLTSPSTLWSSADSDQNSIIQDPGSFTPSSTSERQSELQSSSIPIEDAKPAQEMTAAKASGHTFIEIDDPPRELSKDELSSSMDVPQSYPAGANSQRRTDN